VRDGLKVGASPLGSSDMTNALRLVLLGAIISLAGCGQHLGSYAVEAVQVVPELPKSHYGTASSSYGRYLDILVASKTSLTSFGSNVDAIYVDADFCPLRNRLGLVAFGPYSDGRQDVNLPSVAVALHAGRDGLYRYRLYVVVANRAHRQTAEPGQIQLPTYDLRSANRDICLRLFAPGYNLIKSRSDTIRVPASMISAAISRDTIPAQISA
jgi:hypothetical protein